MQRQQDATNETPTWVLTEPGIVVRFTAGAPDAVLITGPVTSDRVRGIRLRGIDTVDPADTDLPTWQQDTPPTDADITQAAFWTFYSEGEAAEHISIAMSASDWPSADDFYLALANAIRGLGRVDGSLNVAIANALGVSPNTAAQYVNRCRKRGYLPPSRKAQS